MTAPNRTAITYEPALRLVEKHKLNLEHFNNGGEDWRAYTYLPPPCGGKAGINISGWGNDVQTAITRCVEIINCYKPEEPQPLKVDP